MNWYVLYVRTGSELEVAHRLRQSGMEAVALQECVTLRKGGRWQSVLRILFQGYVFILLDYTPEIHHVLKNINTVFWLLPKGNPIPLPEAEMTWLIIMCGDALQPSKVDFSGDIPIVIDGPLKRLEPYIIKYQRRQRRVRLAIPVLGVERHISLSILPI